MCRVTKNQACTLYYQVFLQSAHMSVCAANHDRYWKTGRNNPYIFLCSCAFLLCLLFFYNLIDLPSDLCRSYYSGQFLSSCCFSCLLESCWSASAITLLFPTSYNALPSPDSLSLSSIHNIKSSVKHYMEQGHLKLLIFRFYVNALPLLSSLRSSSYTSSRRNRNLSCEKVSSMDTWIDTSNMADFVIRDCGTVFEWNTEEIRATVPMDISTNAKIRIFGAGGMK